MMEYYEHQSDWSVYRDSLLMVSLTGCGGGSAGAVNSDNRSEEKSRNKSRRNILSKFLRAISAVNFFNDSRNNLIPHIENS